MKFIDLDGKIREGKCIEKIGNQYVIETIEHENKVIYGLNDKDIVDNLKVYGK